MKHQQVVVDYWQMFKTSGLFLLLACSGYVLIKMVQTIFWLPRYLEKNQRRLEELAETYLVDLKDQPADDRKDIADLQSKPIEADKLEADKLKAEPKKDK